ncbi:MAG: phage holin family protein [Verrucomicrobiota bacterium]
MSDAEPPSPGVFESLGKIFGTTVSTVRNRAELFVVEFHEEKYRFVDLFLLTGLVIFLGAIAFALLVTVLIFLIPREHRLLVAGILGFLALAGSVGAAHKLKERLKKRAFAETVNQIKKDLECLTPPQ